MPTTLITGAASGLGQAVAEALAQQGHNLVLWDLNELGLQATEQACIRASASAIATGGKRVTSLRVNLGDAEEVERAFAQMSERSQVPQLIFHAAGVLHVGDLDHLTVEGCRRDIDVNYMGTVHLLLAARSRLPPGSRVICVSSIAGLKGLPEFAGYCGSKFAVFGFCEAVHGDFKRRGISLSVICPPAVDTPMVRNLESRPALYDLFPFAEKESVVRAVLRAIDQREQFLILVDMQSRFLYRVNGLAPKLTRTVVERLVQWQRKRANP
jgi:NAD(P)-dependent dehydrogenase (short-subunit alcohol dehydrogenase family)